MAKLFDFFVQFSAKGGPEVKSQAEDIFATFNKVKTKTEEMIPAFGNLTNAARTFTSVATVGFFGLTGVIGGFVRSGMSGSIEAHNLGLQMRFLSMEIAGLFIPQIRQVIGWLGQAVDWFRGLSAEQQKSLGNWLLLTAGVLGFIMILGKVAPAISLLFAHPILAGLAVLAAAIGLIAYQFYKVSQAASEAAEKMAGFRQEKPITTEEYVKDPYVKALEKGMEGKTKEEKLAGLARSDKYLQEQLDRVMEQDQRGKIARLASAGLKTITFGMAGSTTLDMAAQQVELQRLASLNRIKRQEIETGKPYAGKEKDHLLPTPAQVQFESIEASWRRVQAASLKAGLPTGPDVATESRNFLESIDKNTERIAEKEMEYTVSGGDY